MNPVTVAGAAAYLLDGKLPEVQSTDLAAAVRQIADSIETDGVTLRRCKFGRH
jgi:hypothetical protein